MWNLTGCPNQEKGDMALRERERDVRINILNLNLGQLRCEGAVELAEIKCRLVHLTSDCTEINVRLDI